MKSFLFFITFLLQFSIYSLAQPGTLDQSFGNGGKVYTDKGGNENYLSSIAIQTTGRIIVTGFSTYNGYSVDGFETGRYYPDGHIDSSFGVNGFVTTSFGSQYDNANSVVVQNDNKIVVSGTSKGVLKIIRYLENGKIDSSFGKNGITTYQDGYGQKVILSPNKKFFVTTQGFGFIRLKSNGNIDSTFGNNGFAYTTFGYSSEYCYAITIQPNGKILLAGNVTNDGKNFNYAIARFNPNGSIDSTFGTNGKTLTSISGLSSFASSVAVDSKNNIVVGGGSFNYATLNGGITIIRYNSKGKIDETFANQGILIDTVGYLNLASSLFLTSNDDMILMGEANNNTQYDFGLAKYKSDGKPDLSFGNGGQVITDFQNGSDKTTCGLLQNDGKILLAGLAYINGQSDFALARYNNEITLPITLSSFSTTQMQNTVLLNWQTASETSNNYFAVERSNSNNTGFKEIGKVFSKGNSFQTQSYNYEDVKPLNGLNYYRLQQVDKDGKSSFSKIISVDFKTNGTLKIYANPVKDILKIEGLTGIKTTLSVVDINGKILSATTTSDFVYNLKVQTLPAGNYFLKVETSKTVNTLKFVKE